MQAIGETLFDVVYLVSVITIGILMIRGSRGDSQFRLFGWMAVVLGAGDAFHLVPRAYALCTTGLDHYTAALGLGKWITSVTMTIFYVLLYYVWRKRYQIQGRGGLTAAVYLLAGLRIGLCMMPQNQWLSADAPLSWGIYRNLPFALLGLLVIVLFYRSAKAVVEKTFSFTTAKTGRVLAVYHVGLNLTAVMLVVRGIVQVMGITLSAAAGGAVSGIAGLGHILLGVGLVLVLLQIRSAAARDDR